MHTGSSSEYGIFFVNNALFLLYIFVKIGRPKSAISRQEGSKYIKTERPEDDVILYRFTNKNRGAKVRSSQIL